MVSIADTNEEYLTAIEKALLEVDPLASQRRMTAVHAMSRDQRVTETLKIAREGTCSQGPGEQMTALHKYVVA